MEHSVQSIFFVLDILQLIFDRLPLQLGTVFRTASGNHRLVHFLRRKWVGQVGDGIFHPLLRLGLQPLEPYMGGFFLFRIAVLHHRRNYRFDLRVVLLASDAETGLVLRDADALFRGIYKAKVKDLLVRLAVLFLPIEIRAILTA